MGVIRSDQFFFLHDFFDSSVTLTSTTNVSANGDEVGFAEIDGAIGLDVADGDLDWGMVLGGDDSVSIVAFSGEINVGEFVFVVDGSSHFGFEVALSACFHWLQIF